MERPGESGKQAEIRDHRQRANPNAAGANPFRVSEGGGCHVELDASIGLVDSTKLRLVPIPGMNRVFAAGSQMRDAYGRLLYCSLPY